MNLWVKELLKNLDKNLDQDQCAKILEACGENCPYTHLPDEQLLEIKKESKDETDFIKKLSEKWWVRIEGNNTYVIFDKCYCPMVNENISGVSKTLCYCSQGNIKRKFKLGLGRDVELVMEKTVLSGDNECRFKVLL